MAGIADHSYSPFDTPLPAPTPKANGVTEYQKHVVCKEEFILPRRYQKLKRIGLGAQGTVCSAEDLARNGEKVAIKKLTKAFTKEHDAKRAYREIFLMKRMKHQNIICLYNLFTPSPSLDDFSHIYVAMDCLDANLNQLKTMLLDHPRIQFIGYQMLNAVNYLHKCGVAHRDLKPSNIVINSHCVIKLLDFGLARSMLDLDHKPNCTLTPYVVTRYYRAPEIILGIPYGVDVDLWSVGCIIAELIIKHPLMPGDNFVDQWDKVCDIVGTPPLKFFDKVQAEDVKIYCLNRPRKKTICFREKFTDSLFGGDPNCEHELNCELARDIISRLLVIDPSERISVEEALKHEYFSFFFEPSSLTPDVTGPFPEARFETGCTIENWKALIWEEINSFELQD